jgi:hypothetical protein
MIDIHYRDIQTDPPESHQIVIVSDGRYFRSGTWMQFDDLPGSFEPDGNGTYECKYWIPLPTGLNKGP